MKINQNDDIDSCSEPDEEFFPTAKELQRKDTNFEALESKWSNEENIKYIKFLKVKQNNFKDETTRRQKKVFKAISKIVKTKSCCQVKNHHQRLMRKFRSIDKIIGYYENYLKMTAFPEKESKIGKVLSDDDEKRHLSTYEEQDKLFDVLIKFDNNSQNS